MADTGVLYPYNNHVVTLLYEQWAVTPAPPGYKLGSGIANLRVKYCAVPDYNAPPIHVLLDRPLIENGQTAFYYTVFDGGDLATALVPGWVQKTVYEVIWSGDDFHVYRPMRVVDKRRATVGVGG